MLTPEQYAEKRQARYERLLAAAERAERESESNWNQARRMTDCIPFGQPILVGHYSESRDRNYRARIESKHRKGYELHKRAEQLRGRAASAANNDAIFSDDPEAIEKLGGKVAQLEARQERMKEINAIYRKFIKNPATLDSADIPESTKTTLRNFKPNWHGGQPFPAYALTNNGANIRRLKERAQVLEVRQAQETTEKEINGIRIVDNCEDNRLQIFFPGKPDDAVRSSLKSHGFRWTPSVGCWQAYRNPNARYYADQITAQPRQDKPQG
jgi:hypothetical protein